MRGLSARRSPVILSILLSIVVGSAGAAATAELPSRRVALAIRGGASVGAYEAGLNWGALQLAQLARHSEDSPFAARPRPIEIMSVAGTSAGGINALLSGLSWCASDRPDGLANSIEDNVFRDVWLMPDVNRLLPADADSPLFLPDDAALARRDFVDIADELRRKWETPGALLPGCRVPLGVTVTRVTPEKLTVNELELYNQRFYIPFELRVREDGTASYFFDRSDYPTLEDPAMLILPRAPGAAAGTVSDRQVIDTIMTTSAFPTAFGRRRLSYCRPSAVVTRTEATDSADPDLICPEGYRVVEAEFSDGGLFDNLPIGLARLLAEREGSAASDPMPVGYLFLEPFRQRYEEPQPEQETACRGEDPPDACTTMPFNFASEAAVLEGALGTARQYELFRELTGPSWSAHLPSLSHELAAVVEQNPAGIACPSLLSYFEEELTCAEKLARSGHLLELAYDWATTAIPPPLSAARLEDAGVAQGCVATAPEAPIVEARCELDALELRAQLASSMIEIASEAGPEAENLLPRIQRSQVSILEDRTISLSSRGAPITGSLLGAFGAFLEYQFREYDYWVGIYDSVSLFTSRQCALYFSPESQADDYGTCLDDISRRLFDVLKLEAVPKGRYVFALLARREFGDQGRMAYAYEPMPEGDPNFRIVHEALERTLRAGERLGGEIESPTSVERTFFDYLKVEGFEPTPSADGEATLLALIMQNPEYWSSELIRRWTSRIVKLERQAEQIFVQREPDPAKRQQANTSLLGAGAWALQTTTYKYPPRAFSPSTAPRAWLWRNVIPYEFDYDFTESDALLLWQPTFNARRVNMGLRFGFGFAGGLIAKSANEERGNYGTFGLDLTVLTRSTFFSGWGVTPAVYHSWTDPKVFDQTTPGFDIHAGFVKNRFRLAIGTRDLNNAEDQWFLTLGIADLPGMFYWLTR